MRRRAPDRYRYRRASPRRRGATASRGDRDAREAPAATAEPQVGQRVALPQVSTVKELADLLSISPVEVIKALMKNGVMATVNESLDFDTAAVVASDLGYEVEAAQAPTTAEEPARARRLIEDETGEQQPRPPVVTILGHVDHGKTTLLDAIRESNVIAQEAGGITQHIGAYQVDVDGQRITFLDTPGHEAFTAMRARGAQATDIAVLVVAADDGVMPQTEEAIHHAQAAGVPIVVAINKIDKPEANPERAKQQLAEQGLVIEEWGGDVVCVPVSAKRREGIKELLENILVVAEVADLKADPSRDAAGVVVEAELDKTKGPLATVLVQTGTLKQGDVVVAGDSYGKVKAMFSDVGRRVRRAGPAVPVKILGLNSVPQAGDFFTVVRDEKRARAEVMERQRQREQEAQMARRVLSLDELFDQVRQGAVKELNIILRTDVQGSIEPIQSSLENLKTGQLKVRVLHSGPGSITESDVMLAVASKAIIIGFNTRPEPGALRLANLEGVDIRLYEVIYDLVDDVEKALAGMLEPEYRDVVQGHAQVRQVFRIGRRQAVAGCYVGDGVVTRGDRVRVYRGEEVLADSTVASLRRFKDDVREVTAGFECGVGVEGFSDFQEGDILETYRKERVN